MGRAAAGRQMAADGGTPRHVPAAAAATAAAAAAIAHAAAATAAASGCRRRTRTCLTLRHLHIRPLLTPILQTARD